MLHNFRPQLEEILKNETDPKSIYLLKELIAENEQINGKEDADTAKDYMYLSKLYIKQDQLEKALPFLLQIKIIWKEGIGFVHPDLAEALHSIAAIYNNLEIFDLSIDYYIEAMSAYDVLFGKDNLLSLDVYNDLACAYSNADQCELALKIHFEVFPKLLEAYGEHSETICNTYFYIANAYCGIENHLSALYYFKKTLEISKTVLFEDDTRVSEFVEYYLEALNDFKKDIPETVFKENLDFIETNFSKYLP